MRGASRTGCRAPTPTPISRSPPRLLCGYLGVEERLERSAEAFGNAYLAQTTLPRTMTHALERLAACTPVRSLLGEEFFQTFQRVKQQELDAFEGIVTAWEREHLLLKA